jgi:energy-converting hydrogenase B subunit G
MNLYDLLNNKIKQIQSKTENQTVSGVSTASYLASELVLIVSILITSILLRKINIILMIAGLLVIFAIIMNNLPLMPKLRRAQNDSLNNMMFYALIVLAFLVAIFYWGVKYV